MNDDQHDREILTKHMESPKCTTVNQDSNGLPDSKDQIVKMANDRPMDDGRQPEVDIER